MATEETTPIINQPKKTEFGLVRDVSITDEMEQSYLDYAMSVIVARALPDVRDGLKPVQRRILYAMRLLGLVHSSAYKKCARIVGETIGKFHPHGDVAVYDALVRLAQEFSLRYPLIQGQGNFGSVDGDPPAAMRYTEARLQHIAAEMLADLDKNTTDFNENFDGSEIEPSVLPAKLPNLLANGVDGIAVGMATKIAPHNLKELLDASIYILDQAKHIDYATLAELLAQDPDTHQRFSNFFTKYDQAAPYYKEPRIQHFHMDTSEITVEQLMTFIPGPDFPTGGEIYDRSEILQAYSTGRGRVLVRAKTKIVETKQGKMQIEILELPYQQNKAVLIAQIANLVKEGKIDTISDLRDESDRKGLKVVVELKRGGNPQRTINLLYKFTPMQQNFHFNMVALENNTPRLMNLKSILAAYIKHRQEVVMRRISHELMNALHRGHILEGLKIALDNLDAVIKTIRESKDADVARVNLMKNFELTEIQSNAILEMQLRRLAALEREKIINEYKEVRALIENYKDTLATPSKVVAIMRNEMVELKDKYGDERRTKVFKGRPGEISDEQLISNEETVIVLSQGGYIKRLSPQSFRTQGRGGKGVSGGNLKETDVINLIRLANTHDEVLFFTDKGRVFNKRVWEIPESSRTARGTPAVNLIGIDQDEHITSVLTIDHAAKTHSNENYYLFVTRRGKVKKTIASEYENIRQSGLVAISLEKGDQLLATAATGGKDQVLIVTANGKSILFKEEDIRPTGRATQGVKGIDLKKENFVIGADVIGAEEKKSRKDLNVFILSAKGYGKKSSFSEYSAQTRGGQGVFTAKVSAKTGLIVAMRVLRKSEIDNADNIENVDDLLVISQKGQAIRLPIKEVPQLGRHTQGVRIIRLKETDEATALAVL